ncbi:hypothetical protein CNYM01_02222 [Colletotrichum nymphaeae SA-01]|uniref:Uncharacterized protein n=1 Tax=Colletotrichum nymphaeae SA-01 TaxID=1460502 RepID=A0A135T9B0_9PEZI|nr:hypothetical protein CNYM01_02222 [Colletotrichum nymphaeae SA-01]
MTTHNKAKSSGKAEAEAAAMAEAMACAGNISLLSLLNQLHHKPTRNEPVPKPVEEEGRTLPFDRERSLCGAFAFLASVKGGPRFIPAVYIEERMDPRHLEVVVATNEGSSVEGKQVLGEIKRSEKTTSEIENSVFEKVVGMCRTRILDRVGEDHANSTNGRTSMRTLLDTLITYFDTRSGSTFPQVSDELRMEFLRRANTAGKSIEKWTLHRTKLELIPFVENVFQLSQVERFEELIHMIPHKEMNPSSKSSLCNMIRKVSRYRETAHLIYRTAKKFEVTQQANVVTVDLEGLCKSLGVHVGTPAVTERLSLSETLERNEIPAQHKKNIEVTWTNSKSGLRPKPKSKSHPSSKSNPQSASKLFTTTTNDILKKSKVHAEVQLIYYYNLKGRRSELPPRFIRSSKDACYLCNAFIKVEKSFYTSRCHGRLYPNWKLPLISARLDLAQGFNKLLKDRLGSAYGTLKDFQRNCPKQIPAESTLSTLNWSVSSVEEEPSVPAAPSGIDVVIVITEKESKNPEIPQNTKAQDDPIGNQDRIQEEPQKGDGNGQQESTSGVIVPDTEENPNNGIQTEEPVESGIHIGHEEEDRSNPQGQAAEDSKATTVVGQDDEAQTIKVSPRQRNASPVQENRIPRISPAIRISDSTRIQSQSPDRRSEPRRKQRPIRIRTSYAVIRKTYRPKERTPSTNPPVYNIEKTTLYSNNGKIETKKRTFPLAREGDTILQERMLPARIRIMMNILANV